MQMKETIELMWQDYHLFKSLAKNYQTLAGKQKQGKDIGNELQEAYKKAYSLLSQLKSYQIYEIIMQNLALAKDTYFDDRASYALARILWDLGADIYKFLQTMQRDIKEIESRMEQMEKDGLKVAKFVFANADISKTYEIKNGSGFLYIKVMKDGKFLKDIEDKEERKKVCNEIFQDELDNFFKKSYKRKDIYHNDGSGTCYVDEWQTYNKRPYLNVTEIEVDLFGTEATGYDVGDTQGEMTLSDKKAEKIFAKCAEACGFTKI